MDGKWLTLDSQALHHAAVSASERYNTLLEAEVGQRLGLRFAPRVDADELGRDRAGKVAVRELAGMPAELSAAWSKRRRQVESRLAEKISEFEAKAGRQPSRAQQLALADEAVVDLRPGKKTGRPFREQLADWTAEATTILGSDSGRAVGEVVTGRVREASAAAVEVSPPTLEGARELVMTALLGRRATWTEHHVRAEAFRVLRHIGFGRGPQGHVGDLCEQLVTTVLSPGSSLSLGAPERADVPDRHRRAGGVSGFTRHGTTRFTSTQVLGAEQRLVRAALTLGGPTGSVACAESVFEDLRTAGRPLSAEQAGAVRHLLTSGRHLDLLVAAAGAGKTTALHALVTAWADSGKDVVGLAPSAAAAKVLAAETGIPTETVAKFLHATNTIPLHPGARPRHKQARTSGHWSRDLCTRRRIRRLPRSDSSRSAFDGRKEPSPGVA